MCYFASEMGNFFTRDKIIGLKVILHDDSVFDNYAGSKVSNQIYYLLMLSQWSSEQCLARHRGIVELQQVTNNFGIDDVKHPAAMCIIVTCVGGSKAPRILYFLYSITCTNIECSIKQILN